MYKKYICIGITIDNIILGESKTPKILNIVLVVNSVAQGRVHWTESKFTNTYNSNVHNYLRLEDIKEER